MNVQARHGDTSTSKKAVREALDEKEKGAAPSDCWGALMWRLRGEVADLREGIVYISAPDNRWVPLRWVASP